MLLFFAKGFLLFFSTFLGKFFFAIKVFFLQKFLLFSAGVVRLFGIRSTFLVTFFFCSGVFFFATGLCFFFNRLCVCFCQGLRVLLRCIFVFFFLQVFFFLAMGFVCFCRSVVFFSQVFFLALDSAFFFEKFLQLVLCFRFGNEVFCFFLHVALCFLTFCQGFSVSSCFRLCVITFYTWFGFVVLC